MGTLLEEMPSELYFALLSKKGNWVTNIAKDVKIDLGDKSGSEAAKFLINQLHYNLYTYKQFKGLLRRHMTTEIPVKLAILVANRNYEHWPNLMSPVRDCNNLKDALISMGFTVVIVENVTCQQLELTLQEITSIVPPKSYILFYYAGHGFESKGINYMTGIECPLEMYNGVSERFIKNTSSQNVPDLLVLILDMCRSNSEEKANPEIYSQVSRAEHLAKKCNTITSFAASSYEEAYEEGNLSASTSSGMGESSFYMSHLLKHLSKDQDILKTLQMVHKDFKSAKRSEEQTPELLSNIADSFFLTQPVKGDASFNSDLENKTSNLEAMQIKIKSFKPL